MPRFPKSLSGKTGGRFARSVQSDDPVFARRFQQNETVASDPGRLRFAKSQRDRGGNCRIDGISAVFKNPHGGSCSERMGCRAHAIHRIRVRPAGKLEISH